MANPPPPQEDQPFTDPTFRAHTPTSARAYNTARRGYASTLIRAVLTHHTRTAGQLTLLLDVGCGPGTATRSLSPHFQHAYACDPGASMIATARTIPSTTAGGSPVHYGVGAAEELVAVAYPPDNARLAPGSVDLITCAMSAHWFAPIAAFYRGAAELLRPGGTLAMWTASSWYCDARSTPNVGEVQEILFDLERRILRPYELRGNRVSMDGYVDLGLPWEVGVEGFEEGSLVRREWNKDGAVEEGAEFLAREPRMSLDQFAKGCGTASMVVRWREANREALARGEVEDCVDVTVRRLREALDGPEWMDGGPSTTLLMIKKKG